MVGPQPKLPIPASKHGGGHFGIKLQFTEGPCWHILRAVWAEEPFCLDNLSWSDVTNQLLLLTSFYMTAGLGSVKGRDRRTL